MKKIFTIIITAALFFGMTTTASTFELPFFKSAEEKVFGPKPDLDEAQKILVEHYQNTAIDPDSVQVKITGKPQFGVAEANGKHAVGYEIKHTINAKNRMGGYAGPKERYAYFTGNDLVMVCYGNEEYKTMLDAFVKKASAPGSIMGVTEMPEFCKLVDASKAKSPSEYAEWKTMAQQYKDQIKR